MNSWIENLDAVKLWHAEVNALRAEVAALRAELALLQAATGLAVTAMKVESDAAKAEASEGIADVMQTVCEHARSQVELMCTFPPIALCRVTRERVLVESANTPEYAISQA